MPRGIKTCPKCQKTNGPRTKVCECGHGFKIKSKPKTNTTDDTSKLPTPRKRNRKPSPGKYKRVEDFRILRRGNRIKVHQGGGPFFKDELGNKHYLVDKCLAEVHEVHPNGVTVYEKNGGFAYLYMGRKKRSKTMTGVRMAPCKISLLNEDRR